jgi:hexosaminidase
MKTIALLITLVWLFSTAFAQEPKPQHNLLPVPAALKFQTGRLPITEQFTIALRGHRDARLQSGIERMSQRLGARTGFTFARGLSNAAATATLVIACQGAGLAVPAVNEDESYTLEVANAQATLAAPTVVGALRGLETFLQLLSGDKDGYFLPAVSIQDQPRFPWRGLMIDIARHWQPMEVIKRNLDGMAAVKLNVLHLHITEDQGFRIESKRYPKLHQLGSDGNFYTQDQMREIIEYARQRGIRVIPEFDMPGHTTSWFVGHPELASKPGPYEIERKWGIFEPVFDPTNEKLYQLLDGFLGEMAALFPDAYLHIGGDEVEAKHWKENPRIQAFMKEKGLADNHALQAYFNQRVAQLVTKHGKRMIGWDEVVHPTLPKNIVVQSWRGPDSLAAAARQGYSGILSNGYYIDLMYPARDHYLNDPIPANTTLTPAEQKLILGGEATMWSEWVSPETIDSRIWPRTAAIAERFWSPREVRDVEDLYRRLVVVSRQLEDVGLLHKKNPEAMLRRMVKGEWIINVIPGAYASSLELVRMIVETVEPVKGYKRGTIQNATQFTPLVRLVDVAQPDSDFKRAFARIVEEVILDPGLSFRYDITLDEIFQKWLRSGDVALQARFDAPQLNEAAEVSGHLITLVITGRSALSKLQSKEPVPPNWAKEFLARLENLPKLNAPVELVVVQPIRELVIAAAEKEKRQSMSAEEWKQHVKTLAAPKPQK